MSQPLTEQQLDEITERAAGMFAHADLGNDEDQREAERLSGQDVPDLVAEIRRQRTELGAEMLAPQQCPAGLHAEWLVDSEYAHACPWCQIDRLRADAAAELLPVWEAVYEPGNVSDYLIGYMNDQDAATGAAEAWMRSQAEVTGRLEWVPWGDVTPMPDGYDRWFELAQRHDDGIDTGPGITVRRRREVHASAETAAPEATSAPLAASQPPEAPVEPDTATRPPTGRTGDPPPDADRAASYRHAADAIESMQGYPHLILPEEIVAALRLLAAGEQPDPGSPAYIRRPAAGERDEQQAHPAEHTWAAELHDPLTEEWVPGTRYLVRDRAVNALAHARRIGPTWKDGTPTERRLVRATTTYTVEDEAPPAVVAEPGKENSRG